MNFFQQKYSLYAKLLDGKTRKNCMLEDCINGEKTGVTNIYSGTLREIYSNINFSKKVNNVYRLSFNLNCWLKRVG